MSAQAKAELHQGLQRIGTEAAGVMNVEFIRPCDLPDLIGGALIGSPAATRLLKAAFDTERRIATAPRKASILCVACPRAVRSRDPHVIGIATPHRDDPHEGIGFAICAKCASSGDLPARAVEGLRRLWPDFRPIQVNAQTVGHA